MKTSLAVLTCAALLGAVVPAMAQDNAGTPTTAEATFIDTEGTDVGTLTLTQTEQGVAIAGTLEGIPEGEHGFHIHETGDCDSADDFESAGGHFNPTGAEHGLENENGPHAGDMPNQTVDASGQLVLDVTNDMVSLTEGEEGFLLDDGGSALMVHSGPDDNVTDPDGNAGDRIACGVIEATPI
jgi:Cu-Zn family superoxide dismutase